MSSNGGKSDRVFLSYSSKDKAWADAACAVLEGRGVRCWIAPRDIAPGTEWGAAIIAGIDACRVMVLIFSDHANQSPQVRREVERAVSKGLTLLPCRVEDVQPVGAMEYALGNTHWLDVFTPPVEDQMGRLAEAVRMVLAAGRGQGASAAGGDLRRAAGTEESFRFPCPACGKRLKATRAQVGRRARCACGNAVTVPAPTEPLAPTPPPAMPLGGAGSVVPQTAARPEPAMPPPLPSAVAPAGGLSRRRHWPWLAGAAGVLVVVAVSVVVVLTVVKGWIRSANVTGSDGYGASSTAAGHIEPPVVDGPTANGYGGGGSSETNVVSSDRPPPPGAPQVTQPPRPPEPIPAPGPRPSDSPQAQPAAPPVETPVNLASLEPRRRNSLKMELVLIKPGSFIMGKDSEEFNEKPAHQVTLTRPFYMGVYEVTRGQFRAFVNDRAYHGGKSYLAESQTDGKGCYGYYKATGEFTDRQTRFFWDNTGFEQTDEHPVVDVTWNDAMAFCRWLGKKEGAFYDLPTEAEWEYVCRAGTTTPYWTGADERSLRGACNYKDLAYDRLHPPKSPPIQGNRWDDGFAFTAPVGSFRPNPWGVHDLLGNVEEWCADTTRRYVAQDETDPRGDNRNATEFGNGRRAVRGGSWSSDFLFDFKTTHRPPAQDAGEANYNLGFRVVQRPGVKVQ
jgi:formylglycine-generating enzyme required for sulfatase activity